MRKVLVAAAVSVLAGGLAVASDKDDVRAKVNQFVEGFNKGDVTSALQTCADETSIIDEIPPYEWHGAGACARWADDYDATAKKEGITDGVVTLKKAKHANVTGDRAYLVIPAEYTYKQKGKTVKQTGSLLTVALQKGASGWRIVGWTWSTGN